jgi:hypothetical protein
MKIAIALILLLLAGFLGFSLWDHWREVNEQKRAEQQAATGADIDPRTLPGLPSQLEIKLEEAQRGDLVRFKAFIDGIKQLKDVKDPRLAWIELDYVVMLSHSNPVEAKKLFWEIKKRTPESSPIYPRIRTLAKTYE